MYYYRSIGSFHFSVFADESWYEIRYFCIITAIFSHHHQLYIRSPRFSQLFATGITFSEQCFQNIPIERNVVGKNLSVFVRRQIFVVNCPLLLFRTLRYSLFRVSQSAIRPNSRKFS